MKKDYRVPGAEAWRFAFPFAAVPKGARVLIYGGGIVGKTYVEEIRRTGHCRIAALADKRPRSVNLEEVRIISPEGIASEKFDLLLIALERQDWAVEVWRNLREMGGRERKMRWIDPGRENS
mgnify:CR=1 FL=1